MSYAIKSGTIEAIWIADDATPVGCVRFESDLPKNPIWDSGLNNIRQMTAPEIAAVPAQQQAARDAKEPDLATMRDQAAQGIADINTFLAIASPTNAQVLAEVKAADIRQRVMIKAILSLATRALS